MTTIKIEAPAIDGIFFAHRDDDDTRYGTLTDVKTLNRFTLRIRYNNDDTLKVWLDVYGAVYGRASPLCTWHKGEAEDFWLGLRKMVDERTSEKMQRWYSLASDRKV